MSFHPRNFEIFVFYLKKNIHTDNCNLLNISIFELLVPRIKTLTFQLIKTFTRKEMILLKYLKIDIYIYIYIYIQI